MHVKKGDNVVVLAGKDRGKSGSIVRVLPREQKVAVEGIGKVKRHKKGQEGIVEVETPIHVSNVKKVK